MNDRYKLCVLLQCIFLNDVYHIRKMSFWHYQERERESFDIYMYSHYLVKSMILIFSPYSFFHSQLGTGRRSTWNRRLHRFLSKTSIQRWWWRWGYLLGIHSQHLYSVQEKYKYSRILSYSKSRIPLNFNFFPPKNPFHPARVSFLLSK